MQSIPDLEERIEGLRKISIFKEIADDRKAMGEVAKLFTTVSFRKGENAFEEKEYGDSIFIIKSGIVEVIKKTMQGDPYVVTELSADMNIFFGEVALLDPAERSATVHCKTDCEFFVLKKDKFIKYGNENPKTGLLVTREISKILCQRLRKSSADIVTLFDALVEEVEKSGGIQ